MKVYAHPVRPERYPQFVRRGTRAVTREALGNEIQFSASRFVTVDPHTLQMVSIDNELDRYTVQHQIGKCFWLNWKNFMAENVSDLIRSIRERDLYLYGAWGYEPGNKADLATNTWGEFSLSDELHTLLTEQLGDHFFGYEMGEQDGRYIGAFVSREDSTSRPKTRVEQLKNFEHFFDKIAHDSHNRMTILCSLMMAHYYARSGYATLLSCEAAQGLPNSQMWYAFMRGASKQYGLLSCGNVSVWNRTGYKTYGPRFVSDVGDEGGPDQGTSLSLMRRILWNEYMYGCEFLGFENSWFVNDDSERHVLGVVTPDQAAAPGILSPVGAVQQYANRLIGEIGRPGVMHTPAAILMSPHAGWNPPRHLYTRHLYEVWGSIPYHAGDHQTHALFTMLYPGYENAGFYADETGFLTATPYGEMVDVLLSDAHQAVLDQYQLLVLVNGTPITFEVYDKLRRFVEQGGHLVVCASTVQEGAYALREYAPDYLSYFGLEQTGRTEIVTGTALYGGKAYPVQQLKLLTATPATGTTVEATVDGKPAVLTTAHGAGKVTVLLPEDGLEVRDEAPTADNKVNEPIAMPYDLTAFVKAYLGDCLERYILVNPTDRQLQYIVTVKDEHTLLLQVTNNSLTAHRFDVVSPLGVRSIRSILIEDDACQAEGYYQNGVMVDPTAVEGEGTYTISAGDVQLFEVTLEMALELQEESVPTAPARRVGVKLPAGCVSIRDFLQENPSLPDYFDSVLVDAAYLERMDETAIRQEAEALHRVGIKLAVDMTRLLNWFPDLAFDPGYPERCAESYARLDRILEKATCYDLQAVLLSTTTGPERMREYLPTLYRYVVEWVGDTVQVHFRNRTLQLNMEKAYETARQVPGMALAFDTSSALATGLDFAATAAAYPLTTLLLSAPTVSAVGKRYHAAAPIAGSGFEEEIRRMVDAAEDATMYLAADYRSWDEIYADYITLFD